MIFSATADRLHILGDFRLSQKILEIPSNVGCQVRKSWGGGGRAAKGAQAKTYQVPFVLYDCLMHPAKVGQEDHLIIHFWDQGKAWHSFARKGVF